jgi:hypothetical protein
VIREKREREKEKGGTGYCSTHKSSEWPKGFPTPLTPCMLLGGQMFIMFRMGNSGDSRHGSGHDLENGTGEIGMGDADEIGLIGEDESRRAVQWGKLTVMYSHIPGDKR